MFKYLNSIDNLWSFLGAIAIILFSIYRINHRHTLSQRSIKKRQYTERESNKVLNFFFAIISIAVLLYFYLDYKKSQNNASSSSKYLLNENFSDNSNHWDTRKTPQGVASIINGNFQIRSIPNIIREKTVEGLVRNSDKVSFKTEFSGASFSQNGYFGWCWGLSDTDGLFIIFQEKKFKIGQLINHEWVFFNKGWLESDLISLHAPIGLEVIKENNLTQILLNGVLLSSLNNLTFHGDNIGFVTKEAEIIVDYVQIVKMD